MFNQLSDKYFGLALKYAQVKLGMIPINKAMMDSRNRISDFGGAFGILKSPSIVVERTNLNPI
tara:strand:+ start:453 stop:641 length:189 start_codon:yes stop_codon:yes gene_type:complete